MVMTSTNISITFVNLPRLLKTHLEVGSTHPMVISVRAFTFYMYDFYPLHKVTGTPISPPDQRDY